MAVMRNTAFLKILGDDALKLLAFGAEPVHLKPRQPLFEAGDQADGAVLVLGGQLRLVFPGAAGERVVGVGQLVDEIALVVATTRKASAAAQTTCELLRLPRAQMLKILGEYPDAAERLRAALAARTGAFIADIGDLADRLRND